MALHAPCQAVTVAGRASAAAPLRAWAESSPGGLPQFERQGLWLGTSPGQRLSLAQGFDMWGSTLGRGLAWTQGHSLEQG